MRFESIKNDWVDYQCLDQIGHQTDDLYLCYCGIEFCPPNHSYGPKIRSEHVIHFIFQGKGFYQIDGQTHLLHEEQAFLIPANTNTYYYADANDPYAYVWVAFGGGKADDYLSQTPLSSHHPVCDLHVPAMQFRTLAEQIMEAKELKISNDIKRVGFLYQILAKLIASGQKNNQGSIPLNYPAETYAEYAQQYIELNYDRITVTDIVNHVGLNRSYLYTVFKRRFQVSPQEYLITYRMNKATELLLSTDKTITDISHSVGYEDSLTFSKTFKKQFGKSPKNYRLEKQKQEEIQLCLKNQPDTVNMPDIVV